MGGGGGGLRPHGARRRRRGVAKKSLETMFKQSFLFNSLVNEQQLVDDGYLVLIDWQVSLARIK